MSYDSQTYIQNRHDFDITFTAEYDNDQTAATLITPTSGKLIKVTGVYISTEGGTNATDKIRIYFATSGNTICTFYPGTAPPATLQMTTMVVKGARNEVVSITSNLGTGKNYYLAVNYKEE